MAPRQARSFCKVVKDLMTVKKDQRFKRPCLDKEKITKSILKPLYQSRKNQFSTDLSKYLKLKLTHKLEGRRGPGAVKPVVTPVQLEEDLKQYVRHLGVQLQRRGFEKRKVKLEAIESIMSQIQRLSLGCRDRFGSLECLSTETHWLSLDYDEGMLIDRFGSMESILTEIQKLNLDEGGLMDKFGSLESIMDEIKRLTV